MSEQYPGQSPEQAPSLEGRIAELQAALAQAQEQRRETERSANGLRLWQWAVSAALASPMTPYAPSADECYRDMRTPDGSKLTVLGIQGQGDDAAWYWSIIREDHREDLPPMQQDIKFDLSTKRESGEVYVLPFGSRVPLGAEAVEALYREASQSVPMGPTVYDSRGRR